MPAPFIELGNNHRIDFQSGEALDQVVGDKALLPASCEGTRVQILATGAKRQIDLVPSGINSEYLQLEAGKFLGASIADSNVDPAGMFARQNTSGKDLWIARLWVVGGTVPALAATADIGTSANPVPVGGSNNIFDGIDLRNGGVVRDWDSALAADHPLAGRPSRLWLQNEWLSMTMATGDVTGFVGKLIVQVVALNDLKTVF
jgi:hypothetical protein